MEPVLDERISRELKELYTRRYGEGKLPSAAQLTD
jgi:hypothetical protein